MQEDERILLKTSRFRVERAVSAGSDGQPYERQIIRHPGSVVLVPLLADGRICLIKSYRVSVDRTLIELPAGTLESAEEPESCARRELIEETGYRASTMEPLIKLLPAPGIMDETMHLFVAEGLRAGEPDREVGEQIENYLVTMGEALQMIRTNEICDAKTIVGLMYFERFYRETDQCSR